MRYAKALTRACIVLSIMLGLNDHMFAPIASWSLVEHLALVHDATSGQSA